MLDVVSKSPCAGRRLSAAVLSAASLLAAGCTILAPLSGNISEYGEAPPLRDDVHASNGDPTSALSFDTQPQHSVAGTPQLIYRMDRVHLPLLLLQQSGQLDKRAGNIREFELERAIGQFYNNPKNQLERRNRVQDHLMMASEHRCNVYKLYLKNTDVSNRTFFNSASTILASAGAIATGTVNTRAFAGLSAMFGGVGAQLSEDLFLSLATHIIVPGIDEERRRLRTELTKERAKSIREYTLEAALTDAARYHGACSLDTGLRHAVDQIKEGKDVGVKRAAEILGHVSAMQQKMLAVSQTQQLGKAVWVSDGGASLLVSSSAIATSPTAGLAQMSARLHQIDNDATQALDLAQQTLQDSQARLERDLKAQCKAYKLPEDLKPCTADLLGKAVDQALSSEKDPQRQSSLEQLRQRIDLAYQYLAAPLGTTEQWSAVRKAVLDDRLSNVDVRANMHKLADRVAQLTAAQQREAKVSAQAELITKRAELDGELLRFESMGEKVATLAQKISLQSLSNLQPGSLAEAQAGVNGLIALCTDKDADAKSCVQNAQRSPTVKARGAPGATNSASLS